MRTSSRSVVALPAVLVTVALLSSGCGHSKDAGTAAPVAAATAIATSAAPAPTASGKTGSKQPTAAAIVPEKNTTSQWGQKVGAAGKITVRDVNLVARSTVGRIKVYRSSTGATPAQTLSSPLPSGAPLVFLVQERRGDRLRVLLPIRPNESQGWIRAADVKLSQLDYRITVSAKAHQLSVYQGGSVVLREPVGLGKGATPTPGGVFYLKELLRPRDPAGAYGPYAYGLSGYSNVLNEFGGGDGEIGIHGTNDPSSVGKDVSHGCIRMRNAAITKLAKMLPLGVPVQMIA